MIMLFGPAGSGKTTQAELLAEKLGRTALSVGQICREQFTEYMKNGDMVPVPELAVAVMKEVRKVEAGGGKVVLDGQPWGTDSVPVMVETGMMGDIEVAVVLDVPREECLRRLGGRGRDDDREEVWAKKLDMFEQKIYSFLTGVEGKGVRVLHVDGTGGVDEVNLRIVEAVQ